MKRGVGLVLAAVVALATGSTRVWSTECPDDRRPMPQRMAELPTGVSVFAGTTLQVRAIDKWVYEAKFAVDRAWRGAQAPFITVRSNVYILGPELKEGEQYLVFARRTLSTDWLEAEGCSYTSKLTEAGPWLEVLGKPRYVSPRVPPPERVGK